MQKTAKELLEELNLLDESDHIEAKEASNGIGKSFWETVCAFANEPNLGGGYIILGVQQSETLFSPIYEVIGVNNLDKIQRDIGTQSATTFNIPIRPQISVEILNDKTVVIVFVQEAEPSEKPIFIANSGLPKGAFRRIGSTDQRCQDDDLAVFYQSRHTTFYDATLLKDADLQDIDLGALGEYRKLRAEVNPGASELELSDEELLRALRCAELDAALVLRPTVAGIALFGSASAQRRLIPSIRVDYMRMPGNEWVSDPLYRYQGMEARGPLFSVLRRIETAIWEDIGKAFYLPEHSLQSIETPIISGRIIREALTNALMHRSYQVQSSVQVIRYANRLEIRNPGFSLVAPEKLGEPGSVRRNPFIAEVLHDINIAETKGTGIPTMRKLMREANLEPPFFESKRDTNQFVSTFLFHHLLSPQDWQWLGHFQSHNLTSDEARALIYVREMGEIDNSMYRTLNSADTLDASKHLRRLRDSRILQQNEKGRSTFYTSGELFEDALNKWKPTNLDEKPTNLDEKPTNLDEKPTNLETPEYVRRITHGLSKRSNSEEIRRMIMLLCASTPLTAKTLAQYLERNLRNLSREYLNPMIKEGILEYTIPEIPNHFQQAYRTVQPLSSIE
jgi:ATP-dependent DNA helicase RecG